MSEADIKVRMITKEKKLQTQDFFLRNATKIFQSIQELFLSFSPFFFFTSLSHKNDVNEDIF